MAGSLPCKTNTVAPPTRHNHRGHGDSRRKSEWQTSMQAERNLRTDAGDLFAYLPLRASVSPVANDVIQYSDSRRVEMAFREGVAWGCSISGRALGACGNQRLQARNQRRSSFGEFQISVAGPFEVLIPGMEHEHGNAPAIAHIGGKELLSVKENEWPTTTAENSWFSSKSRAPNVVPTEVTSKPARSSRLWRAANSR